MSDGHRINVAYQFAALASSPGSLLDQNWQATTLQGARLFAARVRCAKFKFVSMNH